jgi:hypothetical protein
MRAPREREEDGEGASDQMSPRADVRVAVSDHGSISSKNGYLSFARTLPDSFNGVVPLAVEFG